MNETAQQAMQPPRSSNTMMMIVLSGIAMLAGFLVVMTSQLTAPRIAENQRIAIEKAVSKVIPGATHHREFHLGKNGISAEPHDGATTIYAGYDDQGRLLGVAARAAAQGYADMIYLLYGYAPDCQCIRGIKVLKLAETPGLGDRIIHDPAFQANFKALDARLAPNEQGLAHAIATVKHGTREHDWEIDAISGATISSTAVGKALNQSAQALLPQLLPHLQVLREAEANQ